MRSALKITIGLAVLTALGAAQRPAAPAKAGAPSGSGVAARTALLAALRGGSGTLWLTPARINFNASNPSQQPVVPAATPVRAYVAVLVPRGKRARWSLRLRAQGARLLAAGGSIPVNAITWNASGAVLAGDGTVAARGGNTRLSTAGIVVARGVEGVAVPFLALVTCNFAFHDSWNYAPGRYRQTLLFTLAAP